MRRSHGVLRRSCRRRPDVAEHRAVEHGAGLIVLGTRGRRRLLDLFDDRADLLTRLAGRPILTVGEPPAACVTATIGDPELAA